MADQSEFWIVVCEMGGLPVEDGVKPYHAFRIDVKQAAREYYETVRGTHETAVLIHKTADGYFVEK